MASFRVGVKEIWEQMYLVEANTQEEAFSKVENYALDQEIPGVFILEDEFEYCNTLDNINIYTNSED